MGRLYRPVTITCNGKQRHVVGMIDTGADETVISERLAKWLDCQFKGDFTAFSASGHELIGRYTVLDGIEEEWYCKRVVDFPVGVTDFPFKDEGDDGIEIVLGVDFLQETGYNIEFEGE